MINRYFDKTFLVNLDKRPDRLEKAKKECEKYNIQFERWPAVDGYKEDIQIKPVKGLSPQHWNKGAAGMVKTIYNIISYAKENNLNSVLIMEDDIEFHPQINEFTSRFIYDLPSDWETFYFGANHNQGVTKVTNNLVKMKGSFALHCHVVRHTIYDEILRLFSDYRMPADVLYSDFIHSRGKSYCFHPNMAYQKADYSDIMSQKVDYQFLKKM